MNPRPKLFVRRGNGVEKCVPILSSLIPYWKQDASLLHMNI